MRNAQRHTTHPRRKFKGHAEASILVDWLNSPGDRDASNYAANEEAKRRISAILDWLAEIAAARDDEFDRCQSLASKVNGALAECALVPEVDVGPVQFLPRRKKPKLMCSFQFKPAPGSQLHAEIQMKSPGKFFTWPTGHEAVAILFNLWQTGFVVKIRRCRNCDRFLYQKFRNMGFCPNEGACRRAFSQKSEEYKANRNRRERDSRRADKERETRELEVVKKQPRGLVLLRRK